MEIVRSLVASCDSATLFAYVDDLESYPAWMDLVHAVELLDDDDPRPAWLVELRANVGPFARSKRLRMRRTEHDPTRTATFERDEADDRDHAPWTLRADVADVGDGRSELTMTLAYGGGLWTGPVLQRVLDQKIEAGSSRLLTIIEATGP